MVQTEDKLPSLCSISSHPSHRGPSLKREGKKKLKTDPKNNSHALPGRYTLLSLSNPAIRLMCISCIRPRALSPQRRAGREERQKVSQNKCVCVLDLHPYFVTYLKGLRRACSRSCKRTYTSSNGLAGDAGVRSWPEDSAGLIHCTGSSLARSSHFRRTLPITSVSVFFFFSFILN